MQIYILKAIQNCNKRPPRFRFSKCLLLILGVTLTVTAGRAQGTWKPVNELAYHYNAGVMLLLNDGTVMIKTSGGGTDHFGTTWDKLIPDEHGSYINGTWETTSEMFDSRLYFSSQVLKDGRVYVAGGEYGTGKRKGEIYNPLNDSWTPLEALPVFNDTISDANSEILDDGRVLQAIVKTGGWVSNHTYIFDPVTDHYSVGPSTLGIANESAWLKLPDNSILFVDIHSTNSERYIPATNTWIADAPVPVGLDDDYGFETGAAVLLPDGRAFFIGATNKTAYYTPSGSAAPGVWAAGPDIPDTLGAPDAAAAMMVNGKILCAFSSVPERDSVFQKPTSFFEFNYITNSFNKIRTPNNKDSLHIPAYFTGMLCLPDGSILYGNQGDDQYYVYQPDGAPLAAGKPIVDSIIRISCDTFLAIGRKFNGITEGAGYGDDWQMATNYPLVRLLSNDSVFYARTYNWTSTGVMRGNLPDTTTFVLPRDLPVEQFSLQVVANGIASSSVSFATCQALATSKAEELTKNNLSVYPNPATRQAAVVFNTLQAAPYSIKLIDVLGRVVKEVNGNAAQGENTYQLQLEGIKKGLYTIILRQAGGVYETKLMVK